MKYRVEYCHDPNTVIIHFDLDLCRFFPERKNQWSLENDDDVWDEDEEEPFFVKRLLLLKGIICVNYDRYSVELIKGDIFSWRSILPIVMSDLETVLNRGVRANRVAKRRQYLPSKKRLKNE